MCEFVLYVSVCVCFYNKNQKKMVKWQVIWDAIMLMWHHCNVSVIGI